MPCDPLLFWRPIPAGSTFKASASGDENKFNVLVAIHLNGKPLPPLRHHDLIPGPAKIAFNAGDHYVFDVALSVFSKPDKPIDYTMSVVDAAGKVVSINGIALQCDTSMSDIGSRNIKVIATFPEVK